MNTASTFPTLLEAFFIDRLLRQRQVSQLPPDNGRAKLISVDLIAAATRR